MNLFKILFVVLICHFWTHCPLTIAEEMSMTLPEISSLEQLKHKVSQNLTEYYMKNDMYLLKWLRASQGNPNEAKDKILNMLEWRKEINMSEIMKEDFSEFEREFPFEQNAVDYEGRPVGAADIAEWDARKIILSGKLDKAIRYVYRVAETGSKKAMDTYLSGRNVSQWFIIANLKGFNLKQHGCPQCLPLYRNLLGSLLLYYPRMVYKLICINTPLTFATVLSPFLRMVHPSRRHILKLYGADKRQWQKVVLSFVSPEQIGPQFGGTKRENYLDDE